MHTPRPPLTRGGVVDVSVNRCPYMEPISTDFMQLLLFFAEKFKLCVSNIVTDIAILLAYTYGHE